MLSAKNSFCENVGFAMLIALSTDCFVYYQWTVVYCLSDCYCVLSLCALPGSVLCRQQLKI